MVGDLAGFAAACFMRGIAYVQVPTTLLAQVDSSVGGKTGDQPPAGQEPDRRLPPAASASSPTSATLATLPQRELIAGLAEVIKYGADRRRGLLRLDREPVSTTCCARDDEALAHAVSALVRDQGGGRRAATSARAGLRAILNFGHTFGHAIEAATGYGTWLHGEAVGCGMVLAADLSLRLGLIDRSGAGRVAALVAARRAAGPRCRRSPRPSYSR